MGRDPRTFRFHFANIHLLFYLSYVAPKRPMHYRFTSSWVNVYTLIVTLRLLHCSTAMSLTCAWRQYRSSRVAYRVAQTDLPRQCH